MADESDPGKVIEQALEIVRKTYQEINAMKNDITNIIQEKYPRYKLVDDYSYGPKYLYLKEYHFVYYQFQKEDEDSNIETYIGISIFFGTHDKDYQKIGSLPGPEIWFSKMQTTNDPDTIGRWDIPNCLTIDERKYFINSELQIGGPVNEYYNNDEEAIVEWSGSFIGYPVVQLKDKSFIETEILEKLNI